MLALLAMGQLFLAVNVMTFDQQPSCQGTYWYISNSFPNTDYNFTEVSQKEVFTPWIRMWNSVAPNLDLAYFAAGFPCWQHHAQFPSAHSLDCFHLRL
jgi:hypothetical protein